MPRYEKTGRDKVQFFEYVLDGKATAACFPVNFRVK